MEYPALDVRGVDPDVVLAAADDFGPTAAEDLPGGLSIFFSTPARRDEAAAAIQAAFPGALLARRDVDDEDWAQRSQANLTPITVGHITVAPPWFVHEAVGGPQPPAAGITITILPSMGFGTGHHATTRLCLNLMQRQSLLGARVLDVGTGSGVLAIAASMLGATDVVAIDFDPDALQSATENIGLNGAEAVVQPRLADLGVDGSSLSVPRGFDLVLANLTGAVLARYATVLSALVAPGGSVIVSGCLAEEAVSVERAFEMSGVERSWREDAEEWVALAFTSPSATIAR